MSIATEIERLQNAKTSIKTAIESKGVEVGDGLIDTYSSKIDEISSGGADFEINDCARLFYNGVRQNEMEKILKVCKNITSMNGMFQGARTFTKIDLSELVITSDLTSLGDVFNGCNALTDLTLCDFSEGRPITVGGMFNGCQKLTTIDVSSLNTSQAQAHHQMFNNCYALENLNLGNMDTSSSTSMYGMFYGCKALKKLDLSGFRTPKVNSMYQMFNNCNALEELDVSNFDTSKITSFNQMFNGCNVLADLDLSSWDGSLCVYMTGFFGNCNALTNLKFMNNLGKSYAQKTNNYGQYKVDLHYSIDLTKESAVDVMSKLYDLNLTYNVANGGTLYNQTLQLPPQCMILLEDEDIAIANVKGWTVTA